ncbi:MAG: hypothetical protein ACK5HT_10375 [Draconibacterium sp.]
MIDWSKWKSGLKRILKISNQEGYLSKQIQDFEKQLDGDNNIPFVVYDIRQKGFIVKTGGLFAYVSFNHMPWKYYDSDSWKAIFPTLTGKIFFGKIYHYKKNPLSIILDGETPQFKKYDLIENEQCKGVVIRKAAYGVFVDIGYGFKWKCGSITGLLHKRNFDTEEAFDQVKAGDIIEPTFWGYNQDGQPVLGINPQLKEWFTGNMDRFFGTVVPVKIVKELDKSTTYLVEDRYRATLPTIKSIYGTKRTKMKNATKKFEAGDIIHCEVIKVNYKNRSLQLKWESGHEIEEILSRHRPDTSNDIRESKKEQPNLDNTIENIIDGESSKKLNRIRNQFK